MPRASQPQRQWIACYDIHAARVRRRVARLLEGEGLRVQRSVFQVEATPDQAERLRRRCQTLLRPGDKLLLMAVGAPQFLPGVRHAAARLPGYWLA
jgi:CRISPR-associated protein Cas2